jgi:hypothetical protein
MYNHYAIVSFKSKDVFTKHTYKYKSKLEQVYNTLKNNTPTKNTLTISTIKYLFSKIGYTDVSFSVRNYAKTVLMTDGSVP